MSGDTFTTQEGATFSMDGATCPECGGPSELNHRHGASGYFNCPACGTMYDEPNFAAGAFVTSTDDDESEPELVHVEYALTIGVTEDSPAPTEDDIREAILRRCTDAGMSIMLVEVERA